MSNLTDLGFEPKTSRTDINVLTTELTGRCKVNLRQSIRAIKMIQMRLDPNKAADLIAMH